MQSYLWGTTMLDKKIIVSTLAVFATLMIYGALVFGILLADFYVAHQGDLVIRPAGEELMGWLAAGQLIMAFAFVWIWKHAITGNGLKEGLRYGFFMGLFWAPFELINYAFLPIKTNVMIIGFTLDIVMLMLAGAVLSLIWKTMADTD